MLLQQLWRKVIYLSCISLISLKRSYTVVHSVRNRFSLLNISRKSTWHGHNWLWYVLSCQIVSDYGVTESHLLSFFFSIWVSLPIWSCNNVSGGTEEHSERQKLKQQCTETNYSEIQRSKVEVLSVETILTHSNTMYETYFSENGQIMIHSIRNRFFLLNISTRSIWYGHNWLCCVLSCLIVIHYGVTESHLLSFYFII